MFHGTHDMLGVHGFGWVFWILILIGGVWLVSRMINAGNTSTGASSTGPSRKSPLDVLKRRYADGDISTEEYEERKQHLEKDR